MEIKHIRWIAVVGLIAIVELQYVWLVNTYKLTKESIQMKGEELFPEAALQEVFLRVSKTKKDSTVTMNVNFDAEKDMESSRIFMEDGSDRSMADELYACFVSGNCSERF